MKTKLKNILPYLCKYQKIEIYNYATDTLVYEGLIDNIPWVIVEKNLAIDESFEFEPIASNNNGFIIYVIM